MPDLERIYNVIGATWPAAQILDVAGVKLRKGLGGGNRVSAATADQTLSNATLQRAEDMMRVWQQKPTFMIRDADDELDAQLDLAGYSARDWTRIYLCDIEKLTTTRPKQGTTFAVWPPLAVQQEIWLTGGIGPDRIAVMERAHMPKTTILGRLDEQPASTLFVGVHDSIAMIHAVEVLPQFRRKGLAKELMAAAAFWAKSKGATQMALLTTTANGAANPLYASLGMDVVGSYHYRQLPE